MDLALLDSQRPEFVIVSGDRGGAFGGFSGTLSIRFGALTPPGAIAVGQLCYRGDSFGSRFKSEVQQGSIDGMAE